MLLKVLFVLIILYYVLRTSGKLIRALRGEDASSRLNREHMNGGERPTNGQTRAHEDVEDAKFVDL